jgi:hypothetical protein
MAVLSPVQAIEIRQFGEMQLRHQRGRTVSPYQEAKNALSCDDNKFTNSAGRPVVTPNPDGTFTIQKEPPTGNSEVSKAQMGLVIPPQVVTPIFLSPEKKQ